MLEKIKSVTPKQWLFIGAGIGALFVVYKLAVKGGIKIGPGVQTDVDNNAMAPEAGAPSYINYNTGNYSATPLPTSTVSTPSQDHAAAFGCCDDKCAQSSQLATGDAYTSLSQLLTYYQNTNPVYLQLYQEQLKTYSAYFASGQSYSKGGVAIGVAADTGTTHKSAIY